MKGNSESIPVDGAIGGWHAAGFLPAAKRVRAEDSEPAGIGRGGRERGPRRERLSHHDLPCACHTRDGRASE